MLSAAFERLDFLNNSEQPLRDDAARRTGPRSCRRALPATAPGASNRQTGTLLQRRAGLRQVMLAHLSQQNNEPAVAMAAATACAEGTGFGNAGCAAQDVVHGWGRRGGQMEMAL